MSHNTHTMKKTFYAWLPLALLITVLSALIHVAVQQNYRMTGNDPQIQLAEDASAALATGLPPEAITTQQPTDIAKSLSPFFVVFDDTYKPISGTGVLDGKLPTLPSGVFDYAKSHGENRFTWQPKSGVRQAVVLSQYKAQSQTASSSKETIGYIAVGRSLSEIEKRSSNLGIMVLLAWLAALLLSFLSVMLAVKKFSSFTAHEEGAHSHDDHSHHDHAEHKE